MGSEMCIRDSLRWDSLGEYMALASSLQHLGDQFDNSAAKILGKALDKAIGNYLDNSCSPSRNVNELDNRGSVFFLTLFWAEAMAEQEQDLVLSDYFRPIAKALSQDKEGILSELNVAQGRPQDIGGYYKPEVEKASLAMRPSSSFNKIIENISQHGSSI